MQQLTLFDCLYPQFKITKPVRLIECFAGYGSQALALKYMGIKFEHWKICEWAINSIQAYKDIHFFNDATDYSLSLSLLEIINYLENKGISKDYSNPMQRKEIERLGENKCRKIYNNIISTHNLVNITQVKGKDLNIIDTNKFQYILTYSFPCQDLSLAGLQKGMTKGSGTRSGLLWEVERILDELSLDNIELPILLMENVPQIHSQQNIADFKKWLLKLEKLGYTNFCEDVNSKNYGIPQNRVRTFCLSIPRKEIAYSFLPKIKLKKYLFDLLESNVDEKFYLSEKMINFFYKNEQVQKEKGNGFRFGVSDGNVVAKAVTTRAGSRMDDNLIKIKNNGNNSVINRNLACTKTTREWRTRADTSDYICDNLPNNYKLNQEIDSTMKMKEQLCDRLVESTNGICNTLTIRTDVLEIAVDDLTTKNKRLAQMINDKKIDIKKVQAIDIYNQTTHDEMHTIKTNIDKSNMTAVTQNLRIRKLTPKECFRLMGVKDEDFEKVKTHQTESSLYHLAGDSIVTTSLIAVLGNLFKNINLNEILLAIQKDI